MGAAESGVVWRRSWLGSETLTLWRGVQTKARQGSETCDWCACADPFVSLRVACSRALRVARRRGQPGAERERDGAERWALKDGHLLAFPVMDPRGLTGTREGSLFWKVRASSRSLNAWAGSHTPPSGPIPGAARMLLACCKMGV